jgi:tetratricopeptide (TPR) repeat protein
MGDCLYVSDLDQAMRKYGEAERIRRAHVEHDPSSISAVRNLCVAVGRIADAGIAQRKWSEIKDQTEERLRLTKRLMELDPNNHDNVRQLWMVHGQCADVCLYGGDFVQAKQHYETKLSVATQLAEADPTSVTDIQGIAEANLQLGGLSQVMQNVTSEENAITLRQIAMREFQAALRAFERMPTGVELTEKQTSLVEIAKAAIAELEKQERESDRSSSK